MKKLILQMNISVDGFVADAQGKMDWMIPESDPRQIEFLNQLTNRAGTIILGRKMALEAIPHWEKLAKSETQNDEVEFAKFFVNTPKIVFSKTISAFQAKKVSVESGDLAKKINELKSQSKKDIIVYGGAGFVSSLIENQLIDELNLFVHPVAIGKGPAIFKDEVKLNLLKSEAYENGIVLHRYAP